jgi:hypothetical protein
MSGHDNSDCECSIHTAERTATMTDDETERRPLDNGSQQSAAEQLDAGKSRGR